MKRTRSFLNCLCALLVMLCVAGSLLGQEPVTKKYDGYLFAKLGAIGTKSEGPIYFLQLFNNKDVAVEKKCKLWENDTTLHKNLGKKVTINGSMKDSHIKYKSIAPL